MVGRERLMLVPGMRICLAVGSHVSALGFRRRELGGCGACSAYCKCKDRDGWSPRAQGRSKRVERDRGSLYICVKTPARSCLHEGTLTCMQPWSSIRFRCPAARLPTPQQGRASARLLRSQARACFVWSRLWAIRRSEQRLLASVSCRGRRRQGTRVQGSWVHRRRLVCRHRS